MKITRKTKKQETKTTNWVTRGNLGHSCVRDRKDQQRINDNI